MTKNIQPNLKTSPRVLIVDNDSRTCESLYELLTHWGYTVVIAEGEGEALLADAKNKAHDFRCQLAVVDMRLIDDSDVEDKSGLDLVNELKPALSLTMSGYGDDQVASESLEEKGAVSFIGKQWSPQILKQKLEKVSYSRCAYSRNLVINPPEAVERICALLSIEQEFKDQIYDVLGMLIPDGSELSLDIIKTESLSRDYIGGQLLLKVQVGITKLDYVKLFKVENYSERSFEINPLNKKSVILWDIGGVFYPFVDATGMYFRYFGGEIDNTSFEG